MLSNYQGKYTGAGQTVVVIDTGLSNTYQNDNVVYSYDFANGDGDALSPDAHHGGMVAQVAQQVASDIKIIHLKVFADNSQGAYTNHIEQALQWVVANTETYNITAVNLSLGSGNVQAPTTWSGSDEYEQLDEQGVIVTVASGNSAQSYSTDGVNTLSSSESVFSVSAVNSNHEFTYFSQQHKDLTDIAALGKDVTVTKEDGSTPSVSGTSFSAPIIAATAALVQEAAIDLLGHKITDEQFMDLIQKTGDQVQNYNINTAQGTTYSSTTPNGLTYSYPLEQVIAPENDPKGYKSGAYALDLTSNQVLIQDSVSAYDDKDFYKFTLNSETKVDFLLTNLDADVDLNLHSENGGMHYGWAWGNVDIEFSKTLKAGTYYLEVDSYDHQHTTYDIELNLKDLSTPEPDPSPTPDPTTPEPDPVQVIAPENDPKGYKSGAYALDLTSNQVLIQDSVSAYDDKDFYKFTLNSETKVDFLLTNLDADVDLNLHSENGGMHYGWAWGNVDIEFSKTLKAGTYYLEVGSYDHQYSDYDIELTLEDVLGSEPDPTTPTNPVDYKEVNVASVMAYFEENYVQYA